MLCCSQNRLFQFLKASYTLSTSRQASYTIYRSEGACRCSEGIFDYCKVCRRLVDVWRVFCKAYKILVEVQEISFHKRKVCRSLERQFSLFAFVKWLPNSATLLHALQKTKRNSPIFYKTLTPFAAIRKSNQPLRSYTNALHDSR